MLYVEKIGGLVQKHDVGIFENKLAQHYFGALSAGKFAYHAVVSYRGNAQSSGDLFYARIYLVKALFVELFEKTVAFVYHFFQPLAFRVRHFGVQRVELGFGLVQMRESGLKILEYRFGPVDVGVLVEIIVSYSAQPYDFARVITDITGDYVDKRAFPGAV